MKLYHFELNYQSYETYIGFDAIAPSKNAAWQMYLNEIKSRNYDDELDKDITHYDIQEYDPTEEVCLPIFNNG